MTPPFQSTMDVDVLKGSVSVICKVWVDDVVVKIYTPEELYENCLLVLVRLTERGLLAANLPERPH